MRAPGDRENLGLGLSYIHDLYDLGLSAWHICIFIISHLRILVALHAYHSLYPFLTHT